jgi:hypothetical protein
MGSMLKFDSDRREVVRERRHARMERKAQRREDRERKRTAPIIPVAASTEPSSIQRAAQQRVRETVDRIVEQSLERHDRRAATTSPVVPVTPIARNDTRVRADASSPRTAQTGQPQGGDRQHTVDGGGTTRKRPVSPVQRASRRDRDLAEFRERRQEAADAAREEAGTRIARGGELASVADALAALTHPAAAPWLEEREQLERALCGGRVSDVGAEARRALWVIARDAARTSRRATRDPDLAMAACVAYAIIARAPRTALRSTQRARPTPRARPGSQRAFWR